MIEVFHEESVKPTDSVKSMSKFRRTKFVSWMFLGTAVFFTLLLFISLNVGYESMEMGLYQIVPVLIIAIFSYVMYGVFRRKKHNYLVDYDYTFITGELRIAKVLNGLKRRAVAKISCSNISAIGKLASDQYLRYSSTPGIKKIIATPNEESDKENVYFMVCMYKGLKTLLIFQPSVALLLNIRKFSSRTIDYTA